LGVIFKVAKPRLVVLPELTSPEDLVLPPAKQWCVDNLGRSLVFAGSFHTWDGPGAPFNQMPVVDEVGVRFHHRKRGFFKINHQKLTQLPGWEDVFHLPSSDAHRRRYVEDIRHGGEVLWVESELGRVAGIVCADGLQPTDLLDTVMKIRPDILIVALMSMKTAPFHQLSDRLTARGIGLAFVNARCICPTGETLAMLRLLFPAPPPGGGVSGYLRWIQGDAGPEYLDHAGCWLRCPPEGPATITENSALLIDLAYWWSR